MANIDFSRASFATQLLIVLLSWWIAAAVVTAEVKDLVRHGGEFPCPLALTAITNALCGILSWILLLVKGAKERKMNCLTGKHAIACVAVIGIVQGFEYGLLNLALSYLTMSLRQMIMATGALYTFITAQCWRLPPAFTWKRFGCMVILAFGGLVEAFSASNDANHTMNIPLGMLCLVTAMTLSSQRWAACQIVFQNVTSPLKKYNKLECVAWILPCAAVPCILTSLLVETIPPITASIAKRLTIMVAGILVITVTELQLVHLTSSTTGVIFSLLHNIPIVLCGVIFFHDTIGPMQIVGFVIILSGSFLYAMVTDIQAKPIGTEDERELLPEQWGEESPESPMDIPLTTKFGGTNCQDESDNMMKEVSSEDGNMRGVEVHSSLLSSGSATNNFEDNQLVEDSDDAMNDLRV